MYMNGNDMKWRKMKGNALRWTEGTQSVFSWDVIIFFNFLLLTAISIWFQLISSMSFHYLLVAIVFTQYAVPFISLIAAVSISFQFFSFHFLSNTFVFFIFNVLLPFRWLNYPGWLQKVSKIMVSKVLEWSELFYYQRYWNSS